MSALGILIGFYGYLFPGNINLMVLDLFAAKRYYFLFIAATVVVLFESLYCFFTLHFINQIDVKSDLFYFIKLLAYLLTLVMGLWMVFEKSAMDKNNQGNIQRGIISAVIHPQQIPFWLLMGFIFHDIIFSEMNSWAMPYFVIYNAIGTFMILFCYAFYGNQLLRFLKLKINTLNKSIGIFYIVISIVSLIKI